MGGNSGTRRKVIKIIHQNEHPVGCFTRKNIRGVKKKKRGRRTARLLGVCSQKKRGGERGRGARPTAGEARGAWCGQPLGELCREWSAPQGKESRGGAKLVITPVDTLEGKKTGPCPCALRKRGGHQRRTALESRGERDDPGAATLLTRRNS